MIQSKTEAWGHQSAAIEKILANKATGVFYGMGTGKSKIVVDSFRNSDCKRLLILCPKTVVPEWPDQFKRHCADPCPEVMALGKKAGSTAKKAKLVNYLTSEQRDGQAVVVVNYESAKTGFLGAGKLKDGSLAKALFDWKPDMIVCDESHKIKAHNSTQSKFAWRLGMEADKRVCLTGTPQPNNPLDYFGQFRFLDESVFGRYFGPFRSQFAVLGGPNMVWVKDFKNVDQLKEMIRPHSLQVKSADVLDLPPYQDLWSWAALEAPLKAQYKMLEEESITYFDEQVVTTENALVKAIRLQQILSGELPSDDGERLIETKTPKEGMLAEIVSGIEPTEPVVVFGNFKADMKMVARVGDKYRRRVFELSGSHSELQDWCEAVDGWREEFKGQDGKLLPMPILAVNIKAGGAGINQMVRARYCVFISTGYSYGDYEQARARLHRPGQERSVVYYHLGIRQTIDETIEKAIATKGDWAELIVSSLKSGVW